MANNIPRYNYDNFYFNHRRKFYDGGNVGEEDDSTSNIDPNKLTAGISGIGTLGSGLVGATTPSTSIGGGIAKGALGAAGAGAAIGTMFAPGIGTAIGAGAGALVGGITGALGASSEKKAEEAAIEEQKRLQNRQLISQDMQRFNESNSLYANGGNLNLTEYNGLGHNQGGINLGNTGNQVEDGETRGIGRTEDFVFSDRVKDKETGKTYADMSKRIEKKFKGLENDTFAIPTKDKLLDELAEKQEAQKEETYQKDLAKLQKAHPDRFHTMPDGTIMPGATHQEGAQQGQQGQYANGGNLKYQNGGDVLPTGEPIDPPKLVEAKVPTPPLYSSNASNRASYLKEWLSNPLTAQKQVEQLGKDYTKSSINTIEKTALFDFERLKGQSQNKLETVAARLNKKQNLRNTSIEGRDTFKSLKHMQENYASDEDTRGVAYTTEGVNLIGTQYPVMNPDETGTATHELTHISGLDSKLGNYAINNWEKDLISSEGLKNNPLTKDTHQSRVQYYNSPGEIYARIMQFRKLQGLVPGQKITQEMIDAEDVRGVESPLFGLRHVFKDDATIKDVLEKIAETGQSQGQLQGLPQGLPSGQPGGQQAVEDYTNYAALGGPLKKKYHGGGELGHPHPHTTNKGLAYSTTPNVPLQGRQFAPEQVQPIGAQGNVLNEHQLNIPNNVQSIQGQVVNPNAQSDINTDLENIAYSRSNQYAPTNENVTPTPEPRSFGARPGLAALTALPNIGVGLGSLALANKLDYDTTNAFGYSPDYVDPTRAIQEVRDQFAGTKDQIRQVSRGSGNYLSNLIGATASESKAQAGIQSQYANINAGLTNQAAQFNAQQQQRADTINAQIANQEAQDKTGLLQNALSSAAAGVNTGLQTFLQSQQDAFELTEAGGENFKYKRVKGAGSRPVKVFEAAGYRYYTDPKTDKIVYLDPDKDKKLTTKEKNKLVKKSDTKKSNSKKTK